ncbi:AraC family transcriptional regulator [Clostridium cavendishii DSM 21758]|uniref:AraC family transcriptional regulator n=1 Tax=Clostridium cavendishii DSM 21758 TaxID=1121302 RepID=A0A1M6R186_9CLOT|nr:AraC family transcriptional regulator [Clostridium cavendishii]SHK26146.1 AraC family transcriptional regulator [Clostridium cavendishii DSM 21758]
MGYYINIQKAIDYIENNLDENIRIEDIAKVAGYSVPHFYRVFAPLVGCSVKEYVRKRKLSNAMYDLATSTRSVTEIAFEYGYGSHEAFTRTFKLAYGESPSSFRKSQAEQYLFERINLLSSNNKNGRVILKPEIICKGEKLLLGIERKINQGDNIKLGLLSKVKNEFMEMIGGIENRVNTELYYSAYDYNVKDINKGNNEIKYTYFYGVEVSEYNDISKGMVKKVIPKAKYAIFNYDITNNTLNGEILNRPVYDYIDGVWLPNSGLELSELSDYEVVNQNENFIDYYISIK